LQHYNIYLKLFLYLLDYYIVLNWNMDLMYMKPSFK